MRQFRLAAVLLLVAIVASTEVAIARQDPFVLTPILGPVSQGVFDQWLGLVQSHEPGRLDPAVRRALELTPRTLALILGEVHRGRLSGDVERVLARAAILHTDVAATQMLATGLPDQVSRGGAAALHFGMASELVKVLRPRRGTEPFVHTWYVAVASALAERREVQAAPAFLDEALALFPDDPDLLLLAGALRELRASQRIQDAADLGQAKGRVGNSGENLRRAEEFHRRAVAVAPGRIEARVRLGRVLGLAGRHAEALAVLEAARHELEASSGGDEAVDREVRYFLCLFTGEAQEALNRLDEARLSYRRALALYPGAGSALLDVSRLELRDGRRDAAVAAVSLMSRSQMGDDPWRDYPAAGPARHRDTVLAALVAAVPDR